jgi:30S ribosomal protein S3
MRVGIMKSRPAEWFAKTRRISADFFVEDIKVRNYLDEKLARSGVAKVVIRKTLKEAEIIIFASKVGVIM